MTAALRRARLAAAVLLTAAAPCMAQIEFFTPPPGDARVPEQVKRLLDLHVELSRPTWKPDVAFTVRDRDFELPSSARKACVAGRPLTVEIQFYPSNQNDRPDIYRGQSIGCFPQGEGLLIRASDNSPEQPARRYWVGSVRTPAEVARYEPAGKSSQQFDRMVRNVILPIEQGLGLQVRDSGKEIALARVAESNPAARIDHYPRSGWYGAVNRSFVAAGNVFLSADYQPIACQFSDAELARAAVSDAMWQAAAWLPPAQREVLMWNDGRSFVGRYEPTTQNGTGDFYFPGGLVVRGSIGTESGGPSTPGAAPELRFMSPRLTHSRWIHEPSVGGLPPALLIHTTTASVLGPPGTYARFGPPGKKNPLRFRSLPELLSGFAALPPEKIDGFLRPQLLRDEAPTPVAGIAAFPLVLETDDLPQIAAARETHEALTAAAWTAAQRVEVEDDDKLPKAIRPCSGTAGSVQAVWQVPARSGIRELRIGNPACVNGRTRGLLVRATGQVWVGELAADAGSGNPVAVGKGVEYDPLSGNFLVIDTDNPGGAWRAFGDRNGEMLMTLETRGLFITRELRNPRLLYTQTLSDGPVVSRLVIPEVGYFDGMSDLANGFIFGGTDATSVAVQPYGSGPGMNLELKGHQFTTFHAIDGSHSVTGYMTRHGDPFDGILPIGFASPSAHQLALRKGKDGGWIYRQPVNALRLSTRSTQEAPVRIETHVDTALGPPGRYYTNYWFAPGSLPPKKYVTPEPDTLARLADPSGYWNGRATQALLNATFERLGNQQADAYWNRVFAANERYNRERSAAYGAEVQKEVAYEQQRRREQAQRDASLARAIGGAFADLNRSVESSSRQLQQSQLDTQARLNGTTAPRVMTPEQRALFAQNRARASSQFKARKSASSGSDQPRATAVDAAKAAEADAEQKASEAAGKAAAAEGEEAAVLQAEADALKRDAERLESERKAEESRAAEAEAEAQRQELAQAQAREEDERREAEDKRRAAEQREADEKKRQREQEIARSYLPVPEAVSVCVRLDRPEHFRCHSPLAPEGTAVHPQQTSGWRTPQEWNDYLGCKGAASRSLTDGGVYWACGYGVSGITRRDAAESAGVLIQRRTFYCREEENYCRRLTRPAS